MMELGTERHHTYSELYAYFRELEQEQARQENAWEEDPDVNPWPDPLFFPDGATATAELSLLAGVLKAVYLLAEINTWNIQDKEHRAYIHNAIEYLKLKVRAMVREREWLMDYLVSYASQAFSKADEE